ncbi:MAG: macro domain-containing protein [Chitinophagales bacterium]|nr:macro domain-containing protein [Chitinophagales bacterium]
MIFSFPTKNHFSEKSNIKLIESSAINLLNYVNKYNLKYICLPKVGCGLGGLDWHNDIKPLLINIFDDRFKILNI